MASVMNEVARNKWLKRQGMQYANTEGEGLGDLAKCDIR